MKNKRILFFILINALLLPACSPGNSKQSELPLTSNIVITEESKGTEPPATPAPSQESIKEASNYNEYNINMDINPETRIVTGVQKVYYKNRTGNNLKNMYFNLYLNAFSKECEYDPYLSEFEKKIYARGKDYGYMRILSVLVNSEETQYNVEDTVLELKFNEDLKADSQAEISINFEAYVPEISHRTGANDKVIWFGNFLPVCAVYDTYGWHTEPYYPAGDPFYTNLSSYSVKITTPADYFVVSTGEESSTEIYDPEHKRVTTITAKMVRDFAFAISAQYSTATRKTESGVYINLCYYSKLDADAFLDQAEESITYFSSILGAYPYSSIDIVETQLFAEIGMEYPQIIFIDSGYLKSKSSLQTIAHEVGHQWFYNIVGNNQIAEPWLDEGIVSLLQQKIFFNDEEIAQAVQKEYESLKKHLSTTPFKTMADNLSVYKTWRDYYNAQYLRPKLMLYSLSQKMGEHVFLEFVKKYYNKYAFMIATQEDFILTAEEVYGSSLKDFFNAWIYASELPPLYPTVEIVESVSESIGRYYTPDSDSSNFRISTE